MGDVMGDTIRGVPVSEIEEYQDPANCTPEKLRKVADEFEGNPSEMWAESALMWMRVAADALEAADRPTQEGEDDGRRTD